MTLSGSAHRCRLGPNATCFSPVHSRFRQVGWRISVSRSMEIARSRDRRSLLPGRAMIVVQNRVDRIGESSLGVFLIGYREKQVNRFKGFFINDARKCAVAASLAARCLSLSIQTSYLAQCLTCIIHNFSAKTTLKSSCYRARHITSPHRNRRMPTSESAFSAEDLGI